MQAAAAGQLSAVGTTDDCGFSPFGDDTSTSRDTAFTKIAARVEGTQMASRELGLQTSAAVSRTPNALRWSPAAGSRLRKEAFQSARIGMEGVVVSLRGRFPGKRAVVAGLGFSLIATLLPAVGVSAGPGPIGDGLIRRPGGVLKGNGIYNNTAAGQMIYGGAYPAGTVRWAYIYAQNDFIDQRALLWEIRSPASR
jgi:hypothetical protein